MGILFSQVITEPFGNAAGSAALLLPALLRLRPLDTGWWGTLLGRGPLHQPPEGTSRGAAGAPHSRPPPATGRPLRAPPARRAAPQGRPAAHTPDSSSRSRDYDWLATTSEAPRRFLSSQRDLPPSLRWAATAPRSPPVATRGDRPPHSVTLIPHRAIA